MLNIKQDHLYSIVLKKHPVADEGPWTFKGYDYLEITVPKIR